MLLLFCSVLLYLAVKHDQHGLLAKTLLTSQASKADKSSFIPSISAIVTPLQLDASFLSMHVESPTIFSSMLRSTILVHLAFASPSLQL